MKNKEEMSIEHHKLEEEVENIAPTTEVDPYLAKERQKEARQEEKKFEKVVKVTQSNHEAAVERLTLRLKDEMEKQETIGSPADMSEKRVIIEPKKPEMTKRKHSFFRRMGSAAFFLIAGLIGAQHANATNTTDTLEKKVATKTPETTVVLSQTQMRDWNAFVDFVESKGYKGSKELDVKGAGLGKKLMDEFKKLHPETSVNYEMVAQVQQAMVGVQKTAQEFSKRRNDPDAENIMGNISKVDGWPGSKTTQFKFPLLREVSYENNVVVGEKNKGLVGANFLTGKSVPPGAKVEKLAGGYYYEDPDTGDLVKLK
jgi:hypothetical protein